MNNSKINNLKIIFINLAPVILFLSLNIFKNSYYGYSYIIYSFLIPVMWVVLGWRYSDKTSKNINIILFYLYAFFLYSYTRSIEPVLSKDSLYIITMLFFIMSSLSVMLLSVNRIFTTCFVLIGMSLIALISTILTIIYKSSGALTKDSIYAVLQSDQSEIVSFLSDKLLTTHGFISILLFSSMLFFIMSFKNKTITTIDFKLKSIVVVLSILVTVTAYSKSSFVELRMALGNYDAYHIEILLLKKRAELARQRVMALQEKDIVVEKRNVSVIPSDKVEQKAEAGELHVLIIGESLAKFNLSSYGYRNQTTPWLKSSVDKIQFSNAYSNHTHTMQTLSMSLTSSNQYNNKEYYESPSLISELNLAGYKTAWISNQVEAGEWDNLVSVIADESDYVDFINSNVGKTTETEHLDGALYDELELYLSKIKGQNNNFIVLHMMGSHSDYCDRTKDVDINLKKMPNQFYDKKDNLCYDKTVKYTDFQLKKIYNLLVKQDNFSSMIFMPDHGDDVINELGHNSGEFTEHMAKIPMFIWPGNNISNTLVRNLKNNKDKLFTNDLLFDTVLGITSISSSSKEAIYNLASDKYTNLESEAVTLHGKYKILDLPTNVSRRNVSSNDKFMAHRVNSIGALDDAYDQKFSRIEFDIYYDLKSNTILMGHGDKALTGGTLEEFLTFEDNKFARLWLDFKNINKVNIYKIKERLDYLDIRFNLKSRAMIESGMESSVFSLLAAEGWYTSYYLPTEKIIELIEEDDELPSSSYALKLLEQLKVQDVGAISFDYQLYPYVQDYLIKGSLLPKHIKLNTWLQLSSSDASFSAKINKTENSVVRNPNVDNIIIQYPTRFRI